MSYKCHNCNKTVIVAYDDETNRFSCSLCGEIISGKQLLLGVIVADCVILSKVFECEKYTIFKAYQKNLQRNVLIKILNLDYLSDSYSKKVFFDDVQRLAAIDFPNFIQVYESGENNKICYAIFDYFDGEKLSDLMSRVGSLNTHLVLNIAMRLCNALEHASEQLLYRSFINPNNIWINSSNEIKIYNLEQFREDYRFSKYNAPEVNAQGKITFDSRQYIYTVGAIIYEMFSGLEVISTQQFKTEKLLIQRQQSREPTSLKHLFNNFDGEISDFIDKMLKINIDERPKNWQEVKDFFEQKIASLSPVIQSFDGTTNYRTYESLSIPVKYNFGKVVFLIILITAMSCISFFSYSFLTSHKKNSTLWNEWSVLRSNLSSQSSENDIKKLKKFILKNNKKFNDNQRQYIKIFTEELIYKKRKNKLAYIRCKNLTGLAITLIKIIKDEDLQECSVSELYSYLGALDDLTNHFNLFLKDALNSECDMEKIKNLKKQMEARRLLTIKIFNEKKAHLNLLSSNF